MTIVEFLTRRYDELEVTAQRAADESADRWEHEMEHGARCIRTVDKFGTPGGWMHHERITHDYEGLSDSVSEHAGDHIALHDPAYVLADVATKRSMLTFLTPLIDGEDAEPWFADEILRRLAAPFAAHADFDPGWDTP